MVIYTAAVNTKPGMALIALMNIMKSLQARSLKNQVIMILVFVGGTHIIKQNVYQQIIKNLMH